MSYIVARVNGFDNGVPTWAPVGDAPAKHLDSLLLSLIRGERGDVTGRTTGARRLLVATPLRSFAPLMLVRTEREPPWWLCTIRPATPFDLGDRDARAVTTDILTIAPHAAGCRRPLDDPGAGAGVVRLVAGLRAKLQTSEGKALMAICLAVVAFVAALAWVAIPALR